MSTQWKYISFKGVRGKILNFVLKIRKFVLKIRNIVEKSSIMYKISQFSNYCQKNRHKTIKCDYKRKEYCSKATSPANSVNISIERKYSTHALLLSTNTCLVRILAQYEYLPRTNTCPERIRAQNEDLPSTNTCLIGP